MIEYNLWPLFTAAVGVICWWAGNRQALGRDVRKEWNAQIEKIRPILDREFKEPEPGAERPKSDDINRLEHMLSASKRAGFRDAVSRYEKAHEEHTQLPQDNPWSISYEYTKTDHIKAAITDLLAYMPYK